MIRSNNNTFDENTINEVVTILSEIENNVKQLNKCSSDDFIMLNSYLKKQYNQIESISENVTNVFELTAGNENNEIIDNLNAFIEKFKEGVNCTENEFASNTQSLEKILSDINLIYIPVKNFVQNIVTLNFLTNSLKFNIVYFDKKSNNILDDEIESFRKFILKLKKINSELETAGMQIKSSSSMIFSATRRLKEDNIETKQKVTEQIQTAISRLKGKYREGKIKIPELKRKKEIYSESISHIITNLQYSDIIRQKIEHIQEAHRDMIQKLKNLQSLDGNKDANNIGLLMFQIKDIADLQIAQLVRTNKEYQNAVEIISTKFINIGRDINNLTKDTMHFSGQTIISERIYNDFYNIEDHINEVLYLLKDFVGDNDDIEDECDNIIPQIGIFKDNYSLLSKINNEITELISGIIGKIDILIEKGYDLEEIKGQILNVATSGKSNMSSISKYFGQCIETSKTLNFGKQESKCTALKKFNNNVKQILNETGKNNKIITKILVETERLETKVSREIKSAVQQIKYYDFYEHTAEDIVIKLKMLYDRIELQIEDSEELQELKRKNLKDRRESYTMESERVTHDNVISGNFEENPGNNQEDEDEIEFF